MFSLGNNFEKQWLYTDRRSIYYRIIPVIPLYIASCSESDQVLSSSDHKQNLSKGQTH